MKGLRELLGLPCRHDFWTSWTFTNDQCTTCDFAWTEPKETR